ncbi:hypothetical protein COHA_005085 [Chlorella ohadii]|uniref:Mitochondrial carrier protein n=1 Tax=Chlorella ohadii TaxID=2649997 RepID=A0AAD5H542_9CHLO|nr:hypothetical protein COHA_005085 [Chlorella ohadii]
MGDPCTTASLDVPADSPRTYDGLTFYGHMVAGAVAGIGEHVAMYPVDTIKTRMQALAHPGQQLHSSVGTALRTVLRREGVGGLYRGVTAMALGAGPSHALYFAAYEAAKQLYGGNQEGHHPLAHAAAGATATIVNDGCMNPWDVVKQRMQVRHSPYRGLMHCVAQTFREEGLAAFYKSYWTTLEGVHSATRYNTSSVLPVLRRIAEEEGAAALWRGWQPRVLFHAPSAAICWGIYETAKKVLA